MSMSVMRVKCRCGNVSYLNSTYMAQLHAADGESLASLL